MKKLWSINFGDLVKKLEEAQLPFGTIREIDLSKTGAKIFYDDERKSIKLVVKMKYLTDKDYDEAMDSLKVASSYFDEEAMRLITQLLEKPESKQ